MPHSPPRSHHSQELPAAAELDLLPAATAASTPQQQRFSISHGAASSLVAPANTPASPSVFNAGEAAAAQERRSQPVPAAAVAEAIEQAAAEEAAQRRASLAADTAAAGEAQRDQAAAAPGSAVGGPAPQPQLMAAAGASPVPPTPYAATEYDGDDVVMADVGEWRVLNMQRGFNGRCGPVCDGMCLA